MGRDILKQAAASMEKRDIDAHASYVVDKYTMEMFGEKKSFIDHIKWQQAHYLAELIYDRMDFSVDPFHPEGTCFRASIRCLNKAQWEDLSRKVEEKLIQNQVVVLTTKNDN